MIDLRSLPIFRQEVIDAMRERPRAIAELLLIRQLVPVLEMLTLLALTLILNEAAGPKAADFLSAYLPSQATDFLRGSFRIAGTLAAVVLLIAYIGSRYLAEVRAADIRTEIEIEDIRAFIDRIVWAPARIVRKIGRERLQHSLTNDAPSRGGAVWTLVDFAGSIWSVLVYCVGAAALDWRILAIAGAIYILPLLISRSRYQEVAKGGKAQLKNYENWFGLSQDIIFGHTRIKLDSLEGAIKQKADRVVPEAYAWRRFKQVLQSRHRVAMDGIPILALIGISVASVTVVAIDTASLLVLFVTIGRLRSMVEQANGALFKFYELLPAMDRFAQIGAELIAGKRPEAKSNIPAPKLTRVALQDVEFGYHDKIPILSGVNFSANAGDRILIQGGSGEGKSTLLLLLAGLVAPQKGAVCYNGSPISLADFNHNRDAIVYVGSDVYLFNGSLKENLGPEDKSTDRISSALEQAQLSQVLAELPEGLDTNIGADGDRLSLGQRQRVILSRLFLKTPTLVLLDEATANLDADLEVCIMREIDGYLGPEAIVVCVAHKIPKGIEFTEIYSMTNGAIRPMNPRAEAKLEQTP